MRSPSQQYLWICFTTQPPDTISNVQTALEMRGRETGRKWGKLGKEEASKQPKKPKEEGGRILRGEGISGSVSRGRES